MKLLVGLSAATEGEAVRVHERDRVAAESAVTLAAKTGGEVRLLHVVDYLDERLAEEHGVRDQVASQLSESLRSIQELGAEMGVETSHRIATGKPWRAMLETAEAWQADVIALGPHRDTVPFGDRFKHGSTTSRVVRHAPCDVWILPQATTIKRVLALVDRSDVSDAVVDRARKVAEASGAEKIIAHCMTYPDDVALQRLPHARGAMATYHQHERARAREDLERYAAEDDWTIVLEDDWVVRAAPRMVKDHQVDLVVLAGLSRRDLRSIFLGTTAERILDRTPTSCWVVRDRSWLD